MADYGYLTIRLSDDWGGADFIAQHIDGTFLKVQLKGRLTFGKKYIGGSLHICFRDGDGGEWYIYPHDDLLKELHAEGKLLGTKPWEVDGSYDFPKLSKLHKKLLERYRLGRN